MLIQIDITDVAGPKLADLRNIGLLPEALGDHNLHVSNPSGSRIVVANYETDEVIVSGNGWSNTMQALADHYQTPVQVRRDFGVTGGKSGKVLGLWAPATPAETPAAPDAPAAAVRLTRAQAHSLRQIAAHDLTSYRPGNTDWAPSHGKRRYSFSRYDMVAFREVTCTASVDKLIDLGLVEIPDTEKRCRVRLTEAGHNWLAAHPA